MFYNESNKDYNSYQQESEIIKEIERYREAVRRGKVRCILPPCKRCNLPSDHFARHEKRPRQFYVIVAQIVRVVMCLLGRWKCPGCGKTFTQYPGFALPYKRYILQNMMGYSKSYVEDDQMTYRKVIGKCPAEYQRDEKDKCELSHSSVYRWITTFGGFMETIRNAQQLIIEADPLNTVSRDLGRLTVNSKKFTTEVRKSALIRCRRLLHVARIYYRQFNISIFPNLGTKSAFS